MIGFIYILICCLKPSPTNEEDVTKKSDIEKPNQSKSLSIIMNETINTDVIDSSKVPSKISNTHLTKSPNLQHHTNSTISSAQGKQSQNPISNTLINKSVNNPFKSFKVSTNNDDDQLHPNIKLSTYPKNYEMNQDTDNPVKSKISIPKSPECNSSNLKSNKSTDNDNTELQTELKLSINEKQNKKDSNIENSNQSKNLSPKRPLKKLSNTRITISRTNKVP